MGYSDKTYTLKGRKAYINKVYNRLYVFLAEQISPELALRIMEPICEELHRKRFRSCFFPFVIGLSWKSHTFYMRERFRMDGVSSVIGNELFDRYYKTKEERKQVYCISIYDDSAPVYTPLVTLVNEDENGIPYIPPAKFGYCYKCGERRQILAISPRLFVTVFKATKYLPRTYNVPLKCVDYYNNYYLCNECSNIINQCFMQRIHQSRLVIVPCAPPRLPFIEQKTMNWNKRCRIDGYEHPLSGEMSILVDDKQRKNFERSLRERLKRMAKRAVLTDHDLPIKKRKI